MTAKTAAFIPVLTTEHLSECILGVPIFLWAANNLARVLPRENIYIDSGDDEVLQKAKRHGFQGRTLPESLMGQGTDGTQLLMWAADQTDCDICIQHFPEMILLREVTLRKAIQMVVGECESAVATIAEHRPIWLHPEQKERGSVSYQPSTLRWIEAMGLYVIRKTSLFKYQSRLVEPSAKVRMDRYESLRINGVDDLGFARTLLRGLPTASEYTRGISELSKPLVIKMLVLDVDGVLTDGGIYLTTTGVGLKKFNAKDGLAIQRLLQSGVKIFILSGSPDSSIIVPRAVHLGIPEENIHLRVKDKLGRLRKLSKQFEVQPQDIAYIGDDANDVEALKWVGWPFCPSDAAVQVQHVSTVLNRRGGEGCVAEILAFLD